MAQNIRQNRLFAAEDYTAIYESYVNANLQAYDYDTIRQSMVNYVRDNYPENFNDWIESSEFVAILDLVAQFGHNLAFRVDLNSRNNFLSTAERQDAVYKLAEFLGYQPRRNLAASGALKITSVRTNESVIGSNGNSLGGIEIRYEDTNNIDNLDDFITVMNAVLSPSNQFGSPRKQATINGVLTQFYNLNNKAGQIKFSVSGSAQGTSEAYECVGLEYDTDRKVIREVSPNQTNSFSILYKNDGNGISSNNTGFFVGLKQGTLSYQDFNIQDTIDSLVIDLDATNVNEHDVWVQKINANGTAEESWLKVDNVYGSSTAYNSIMSGERNIFSVKTRENNKISIQFADRRFGNLPRGVFRVWYRTSLNDTYVVRPDDISSQTFSVSYVGFDGNTYTATFGVQLRESITNASSSESLADIKVNAPRIFATQDRMITAQDYSSYLVRQSDNILKIKSVNRTHSGHSRYVDYNEPTGAYANLKLFGTDGSLEKTINYKTDTVEHADVNRIFEEIIKPNIARTNTVNTYYDMNYTAFADLEQQYNVSDIGWQNVVSSGYISTGYFVNTSNNILSVGNISNTYLKYASTDAMIKFVTPSGSKMWARVSSVKNNGLGIDNNLGIPTGRLMNGSGAIVLDANVPQGSVIEMIYPAYARTFSETERLEILEHMNNKVNFTISYDYSTKSWKFSEQMTIDPSPDSADWIMYVDWNSTEEAYTIYLKETIYSFTSTDMTFSNTNNYSALDEYSKKKVRDKIVFVIHNENEVTYNTVYVSELKENNVLHLAMEDKQKDSRPDDPDTFVNVFNNGVDNIRFEWIHVPANNEIIDPSFTNIIDVFTMTRVYDANYRRYLRDASGTVSEPLPPTLDELNQQFKQVSNKKAMSDKIIYRPVKYKPLFGEKADVGLQGRFRVVKVPGTNMTDNEIRSRVVDAVDEFFNIDNWDFGETFYFTELAAYVHKQMSGIISSLVVVPEYNDSVFGDLFQITANTDEIFIPDIGVDNVDIIGSINETTIRMA